jgi:hypothetical protein
VLAIVNALRAGVLRETSGDNASAHTQQVTSGQQ